MINCKYCGAPEEDSSLFCRNCGGNLKVFTSDQIKSPCAKCEIAKQDGSKYCFNCGALINVDHRNSNKIDDKKAEIVEDNKDNKEKPKKKPFYSNKKIALMVVISCLVYLITVFCCSPGEQKGLLGIIVNTGCCKVTIIILLIMALIQLLKKEKNKPVKKD